MAKLSSFILFLLLLAPGIAVGVEVGPEEAMDSSTKPSSSRKLLPHQTLGVDVNGHGENCTESNQALPLEVAAEEALGLRPKFSRKLVHPKMFGFKDGDGQAKNCAGSNQGCFFDTCCTGCDCLGFMFLCLGSC